VNLFRFIPGYESAIYDEGKEPLLFMFVAFLITFALTRFYTRMARKHGWGSGNVGGVHVHHMVIGVILMSIGGILAITQFGNDEIVAACAGIVFGIGLALTLDEFAMILHLKDVYWTEEGRTSIDAMIMGVAASAVLLVSSSPDPGEPSLELEFGSAGIEVGVFVELALSMLFAAITFLKKKPFLGVLAIALLPIGIVTSIRLAKPGSPWAHRFYDPERGSERGRERRERKRDRSLQRFTEGWPGRFERWFSDLVGGAPHLPSPGADERPHEG
jgi:lysyl-tRNA synthetase class 2